MSFSIVVDHVSFGWPDGTKVLDGLDAAFPAGRTGLIGTNGSGKSTLLKIMAGELAPRPGSVSVSGEIGYLPQNVPLGARRTVSDLLEISATRAALHAIESGDVAEEHFAAVGDDWDVEERARAELDRLGLDHVGLDRTVGTLSGGETIMVALAAQLLKRPEVLLLDEPTNNLDLDARERLYAAVAAWSGVLVVVSHDRALLELVDQIAELRDGVVRMYGGNLSAYEEQVAAEQEAAQRMVRTAEGEIRRQQRELIEARTRIDRSRRVGRKAFENKKAPKIVANALKRKAQVTAGKQRNLAIEKLEEARGRLTEAEQGVRDDAEIRIELPGTEVPAGRTVLTLPLAPTSPGDGAPGAPAAGVACEAGAEEGAQEADGDGGVRGVVLETLVVRGPERIALLGPNGSGKTTLLKRIVEHGAHVPVRYLPQRLDLLDDALSVVDNVRAVAPSASVNDVRARLARFLFRGERVNQAVGTLSGGERFRATLAALLSAEPPPQLLLLDEPTNNLDMASVRQLSQALNAYRGALVVASHDVPFLETIGITRWLRQDRNAGLSES
ncbi:ABC-F family ATP-binding cassette domain-containing protein [Nonomuraea jabiensis]|uniref:ATPase subunit of ABC transporter with duplicated ATPase domains n=1 Tax=Nonomuraea jabiensis TaxID=882448 RepID=A0A7W9GA51_9ACTN|nr:ABC-F family ATP-binding cassette domain-containing protein [Nonomuraea jabiensis]MBB5780018.1 ATPase subunit of ABC transporter with duplicated ATPase domains [Nonomuraea jabiensis]